MLTSRQARTLGPKLLLAKRRPWISNGLAIPLLLTAIDASAGLVGLTLEQTLDGTYSYQNTCPGNDTYNTCTAPTPADTYLDVQISKLTNSTVQANTSLEAVDLRLRGAKRAEAEWELDITPEGDIKTKSILRVAANDFSNPDPDIIKSLNVTAQSRINFETMVGSTVDQQSQIFRFETVVTGLFQADRIYGNGSDNGASLNSFDGNPGGANFDHYLSIGGGLVVDGLAPNYTAITQEAQFADNGGDQRTDNISDTSSVALTYRYLDILYDGQADVKFAFDFTERLNFRLTGPDGAWAMGMSNDLLNTITTYASVFDASTGALLPDARVTSSTGFTFAPLREFADTNNGGGGQGNNGSTSVPVPSPALLMGAGLLALRLRRSA